MAFHFQRERRSIGKADEKIGAILPNDSREYIHHVKTQMVILRPRGDVSLIAPVENKRFARLPAAVVDANVDMRAPRVLARPAREPRPHIGGTHDWPSRIENRLEPLGVLETDRLPNVLDDLINVHREDQPPSQIISIEQGRFDRDLVGAQHLLDKPNELRQEDFLAPLPARFHLVEQVAGNLEYDPLHPWLASPDSIVPLAGL